MPQSKNRKNNILLVLGTPLPASRKITMSIMKQKEEKYRNEGTVLDMTLMVPYFYHVVVGGGESKPTRPTRTNYQAEGYLVYVNSSPQATETHLDALVGPICEIKSGDCFSRKFQISNMFWFDSKDEK